MGVANFEKLMDHRTLDVYGCPLWLHLEDECCKKFKVGMSWANFICCIRPGVHSLHTKADSRSADLSGVEPFKERFLKFVAEEDFWLLHESTCDCHALYDNVCNT